MRIFYEMVDIGAVNAMILYSLNFKKRINDLATKARKSKKEKIQKEKLILIRKFLRILGII